MSRCSFEQLSIKGWGVSSRSDLPLAWVMGHISWDCDWIRRDLPMLPPGAGQGLSIPSKVWHSIRETKSMFCFSSLEVKPLTVEETTKAMLNNISK